MKLYPHIHYQGICHKCQKGYYYPDGNAKQKPESKKKLKCVVCGYSGD